MVTERGRKEPLEKPVIVTLRLEYLRHLSSYVSASSRHLNRS
jgi:hypothetical protein